MKLPSEGARWFVHLRWAACALVFLAAWAAWTGRMIDSFVPHFAVGLGMIVYNLAFWWDQRRGGAGPRHVDRHIAGQLGCDIVALTLLLYFSDLPRNPFLFSFVVPMIVTGMYLRRPMPYVFAAMTTMLVGTCMGLQYAGWLPRFPLAFADEPAADLSGLHLLALFGAFVTLLWITSYFAVSIRAYVDRGHEEIRQKEKMVGIGQLVAGIGHQIANPLDGMQNCLRRIGQRVQGDPRLSEYVKMMEEALERIERTTKRVQAFARPKGIELQDTSVNAAVDATLQLLGPRHSPDVMIVTALGEVPLVRGDPYTLQEVLFNLCVNAIAAMPHGGTLTVRTRKFGPHHETDPGDVAIEVADTGIGIPRANLDRVFEPFFTTRAESGGTGLGLGLCRMLLSEMGGRIEVRSEVNAGTTFTVVLRRSESASRQENPAGASRTPPPVPAALPAGGAGRRVGASQADSAGDGVRD